MTLIVYVDRTASCICVEVRKTLRRDHFKNIMIEGNNYVNNQPPVTEEPCIEFSPEEVEEVLKSINSYKKRLDQLA